MAGAYFAKHCSVKSVLCETKLSVVDKIMDSQGAMLEEVNIKDVVKKDPESSGGFVKSPDIYKIEEYDNIESHFRRFNILCKKHLDEEADSGKFFKSYRCILDMQNYAESKNTLIFWKEYIRQLYEQLPSQEQGKLWITLNDMFNYASR